MLEGRRLLFWIHSGEGYRGNENLHPWMFCKSALSRGASEFHFSGEPPISIQLSLASPGTRPLEGTLDG